MIFNLANLLIFAAIDIAGMAVTFPVGIGIALGVVVNYMAVPVGDPIILFLGVELVVLAIILDALAYRKLSKGKAQTPSKGILLSVTGAF